METKVIENGDGAEIVINGRLDTKTSKEAEAVFSEAGNKYDSVSLNMADVSYVSSAGIRAIRNLYMILYRKSGKLSVKNVGENVMEVFEMTGLSGLLNIE
ncbi:MAG: STAS domain-containing protein [Lachnospiraceae bacterium]|nr:STAS domain-containing protein [Lachnospiraceae bacterium]